VALTTLLVTPAKADAQQGIDSTTALKQACEAAVNDFLYVTTDIKIYNGPHENVASGCTISLGPGANFEADQVSMAFAGPFAIYSARERHVSFRSSVWIAPSLGFYTGDVSSVTNVASRLRATGGDIKIITGRESAVQLQYRPNGSLNGLEATGSVFITGSSKLFISLGDTGIEGRTGVQIHFGGQDTVLKAEYAELHSQRGSVSVSGGVPKALVELKQVTLASGGGDTNVSLAGTASLVKAEFTRISSQGGSVQLRAGDNGWWAGVELVETMVTATYGVRVQGSHEPQYDSNRYGTVKVSKSTFSGGSDVILRTGAFGTTEVKESAISSATAIRILTGPGGTCKAESNQYQAPILEICQ
jgi:hypothetical protein